LLDEGKLGGFHFNNRKYADDDLIVGSVNPYELFLIYNELTDAAQSNDESARATAERVAYMIDQSHNVEGKMASMILSVLNCQEAYAKALIVPRAKWQWAQQSGDVIAASVEPKIGGIYRLKGSSGDLLWSYRSKDNNYWSAPATNGASVWAGNLGSLVSLNLRSGAEEWTIKATPSTKIVSGKKRTFYPTIRTPVIAKTGGYAIATFEVDEPSRMMSVSLVGEVLFEWKLSARPTSAPMLSLGSTYLATSKGVIEAWSGVTVLYGEKTVPLAESPCLMLDGSTLAPVRAFAEACGAAVAWDEGSKTITVSRGDVVVRMQLDTGVGQINGEAVRMKTAPRLVNGRTYVPLRFLAESLTKTPLAWDALELTARVTP